MKLDILRKENDLIVTGKRFTAPMRLQNNTRVENVLCPNNVSFKGEDGISFASLAVMFAVLGTVSTVFIKSNQQNTQNKVKTQIAAKTSFEENAVINAKGDLLGEKKDTYMARVLDSLNERDSLEIKRAAKPDSEFNIAGFLRARKDSLANTTKKIR